MKRKRRAVDNTDKKGLFLAYWHMLAPEMPAPVTEYNFDKCLKRRHQFDWAWINERVAVEVDGGVYCPGGGRHGGDGDREKLNLAASLRWLVFRFSVQMLERDPAGCVELVRSALIDSR